MSGEISHLCFQYMTQSHDANKADIFYMATDLIMRFVPKPLLQYVAQK